MEKKYQHVSHLEHVTLRPDSYVGSVSNRTCERWICPKIGKPFEFVNCKARPAALKIFDEIAMNATDNSLVQNNPTKTIRFVLTEENLRVENDGECIPVKIQDGEYIPSMVFFKLLTSEHYDDKKERTSAGLNGYGCKLTSIFSSWIQIECYDPKRKLLLTQEYRNNMRDTNGPQVKKKNGNRFTTSVTFTPDVKFFPKWNNRVNMAIYRRRVCDIAACFPNLKIYLNGEKLKMTFKNYPKLYTMNKSTTLHYPDWDVGLTLSDTFQQISFVNGIRTDKGGTHVDAITSQLTTHIQTILRKKHKKSTSKLTKKNILQRLFIIVNAKKIRNPHFGSQTKEEMTTEVTTCPKITLKEVEKAIKIAGILNELEEWLENKEMLSLQKKMKGTQKKNITGIPKLSDAQKAGTSQSMKCQLILTEGDSAASTAVAGLSVVGRKFYGVMPLKGKMMNVRGKGVKALKDNKEIQNLIKILGLQYGKTYENVNGLRYGQIIVMADQDVDGFHICGLLLNFIDVFWPSLTKLGYVKRFITPLIKVGAREFFSITGFNVWKSNHPDNHQRVKYYKGLGTSTTQEAKEYFRQLSHYCKPVYFDEYSSKHLEMIFDGKMASQRKEWMKSEIEMVDYSPPTFTFEKVIVPELLHYSKSTLTRAIPKLIDNCKEAQRKILYAAFRKIRTKEMKVAQFAAFTADVSQYTHGENSLNQAVIKMAQNFVGSNNLPLLKPNGQFGSRQQNGHDAASPRYIFTQLQPYMDILFHSDDMDLLTPVVEEGIPVEPTFYVPILPMILVNGCSGIATGYRTNILPCHINDIFQNLRKLLRKEATTPMKPYVKNYQGTITDSYLTRGKFSKKGLLLDITELPLGVSILDYKEFLHKSSLVSKFEEKHPNENQIHFVVTLQSEPNNVWKDLKLQRQLGQSLIALDLKGNIQHFQNYDDILKSYFTIRLHFYHLRKTQKLQHYHNLLQKLHWETIFIERYTLNPKNPNLNDIPPQYLENFQKMPINRLNEANVLKCQQQIELLRQEKAQLEVTEPHVLYERDLNRLEKMILPSKKRKRSK